ncbi:MAG TPA: LPS export ABC transporter permease LptF [Gammaproteobacteria bacterium]|nr:LPS export ABC transporter permease LptF [Gammaproteobacteria bacterium]
MVRIIGRYLLKEVILNWLATTLVLWLIVVTNRLAHYLAQAASGDLPGSVIFTLLGLKSVNYLNALLPFSLYLAVLLALGRLYKDSEMVALGACGIGPPQLYRPLLVLGVAVAVGLGWLSLAVVPHTNALGYRIEARAKQSADVATIVAGRFQEARGGHLILYAEALSADHQRMTNVFAQNRQEGRLGLVTAAHAHQHVDPRTGDRYLVLEDGYRYQGFPGDPDYRVMKFRTQALLLQPAQPVSGPPHLDAIPTATLWGAGARNRIAELQWRISLPMAALVLIVIAVPISRTTPREGRYGRMFVAVLVLIIYYNLMGTAQVWVEHGDVPPFPGMWWVPALGLTVAGLLLWRQQPRRRRGRVSS